MHLLGIGIENGCGKSALERHGKEGAVDEVSCGQTKGNVGHAERGVTAKLPTDQLQGTQGLARRSRIGADGERQGIKQKILFGNAVFLGTGQDAAGDAQTLLGARGNAVFI